MCVCSATSFVSITGVSRTQTDSDLITQPSFQPLVCVLDDTSIAEAKISEMKTRRGFEKELKISALRVDRVGRKSKGKKQVRARCE